MEQLLCFKFKCFFPPTVSSTSSPSWYGIEEHRSCEEQIWNYINGLTMWLQLIFPALWPKSIHPMSCQSSTSWWYLKPLLPHKLEQCTSPLRSSGCSKCNNGATKFQLQGQHYKFKTFLLQKVKALQSCWKQELWRNLTLPTSACFQLERYQLF